MDLRITLKVLAIGVMTCAIAQGHAAGGSGDKSSGVMPWSEDGEMIGRPKPSSTKATKASKDRKHGYKVIRPGQLPVTTKRTGDGSHIINRPGQLPETLSKSERGGYTINKPGKLPTRLTPTDDGGYKISKPGELPTFVTPIE